MELVICECHLFEDTLLSELKGLSDWDNNEYKAREFELLHRSLYKRESAAQFLTNALRGLPNVNLVWLGHVPRTKCSTAKSIAGHFRVEHYLRSCLRSSSLLGPLLSALLANNRALTKLDVESSGSTFWGLNSAHWVPATRTTFSALKVLSFNIGLIRNKKGIISSEVPVSLNSSLVHNFIAAAPRLGCLVLKFNNIELSDTRQYAALWDGAGVFDGVSWSRLHHLQIYGCKFKASKFTNFLLHHSRTLRRLELYNVDLYEG